MVIMSATGLGKSFGVKPVLKNLNFHVNEGDKVALLGVNGAGKTTLLRIMTGELSPDEGSFFLSKNARFAYMQQHAEYTSAHTVLEDVLLQFSELFEIEKELRSLELSMGGNEAAIRRYHDLQERLIDRGGLTVRARARSALLGLGLSEEELSLPMSAVSGGQRTRALLAKLLLSEAEILLLDEPTNHLDVSAIAWLEEYLRSCKKTMIVISHDRYFIDRVATRCFELSHCTMRCFTGNYTDYCKKKAEQDLATQRANEQRRREINRLEGIITQQKQWNREKNIVTARSKQKSIDRIEAQMEADPLSESQISFSFHAVGQTGEDVLTLSDVSKQFGETPLLSNLNLQLHRGESVFLLGENGTGKTTLFRMILRQLKPDFGEIRLGSGVRVGYYDQAMSDLDPEKTVLETLTDLHPHLDQGPIRSALAAFLFRSDDVFRKVGLLSGGEKARVRLCALMLGGYNTLLLDEPSNHLDIASKEALETALEGYGGTTFIISHDRYFISKLASRVLRIENGTLVPCDSLEAPVRQEAPKAARTEQEKNEYTLQKEALSSQRKARGKLSRLEAQIETLEAEKAKEEALLDGSDYEQILDSSQRISQMEEDLAGLYTEWETLASLVENQ